NRSADRKTSRQTLSSAGFTTDVSGFRFSVHTASGTVDSLRACKCSTASPAEGLIGYDFNHGFQLGHPSSPIFILSRTFTYLFRTFEVFLLPRSPDRSEVSGRGRGRY